MTENTNLASILDANLDDLADLPAFSIYPAGAHQVIVASAKEKKIGESPAIEVTFRLEATLEMSDPAATPAKQGDECSTSFMLTNEFGVGALKEFLKPIAASTGASKVSELVQHLNGMQLMIVTKVRKDKNDPDKKYLQVVKVEVL